MKGYQRTTERAGECGRIGKREREKLQTGWEKGKKEKEEQRDEHKD